MKHALSLVRITRSHAGGFHASFSHYVIHFGLGGGAVWLWGICRRSIWLGERAGAIQGRWRRSYSSWSWFFGESPRRSRHWSDLLTITTGSGVLRDFGLKDTDRSWIGLSVSDSFVRRL